MPWHWYWHHYALCFLSKKKKKEEEERSHVALHNNYKRPNFNMGPSLHLPFQRPQIIMIDVYFTKKKNACIIFASRFSLPAFFKKKKVQCLPLVSV
jgi:hypothetical protein